MRESNPIHFTKMHGAGNDYIYVNTLLYNIPDPSAAAIAWSKPHFAIGSDGLVLIGKAEDSTKADFSMRIFNNDGSEAMMCGNASRCIGKYVYERGLTDKTEIRLDTLSGVKILKLHLKDNGGERATVESVTVDMLEPKLTEPEQFNPKAAQAIEMKGTFVSMGNPHYVIFVDDVESMDIAALGRKLEYDPAFPLRCNIEFAQVRPDGIRTRVWERGSGITMACGTGACATCVAATVNNLVDHKADIIMDGGTLHIEWNPHDNHIYMTGPAAFAFDGDIFLPE